jgi:hypothetical protein
VVNARVQLLAPSFAIFSFIRPGTRAENATQSLPYFVTASVSFVSSSTVDLPIVRLRFGFKICVHLLQHCSLVGFKNITATATQSLPYFCTPSTRFASSSAFHYPSPCGQCQGPKNLPIYYDTLHSFDLEPALQLQSNCCGVALPPQSALRLLSLSIYPWPRCRCQGPTCCRSYGPNFAVFMYRVNELCVFFRCPVSTRSPGASPYSVVEPS